MRGMGPIQNGGDFRAHIDTTIGSAVRHKYAN